MHAFGRFEPDERGRLCYLPAIPPFPKLDDVWGPLQRATTAVEAFDRALATFPVPDVVGKLFARLDAVHSSGAEGTTTTFTDLLDYQSSLARAKDPEDAREVAATAEAFDELSAPGETTSYAEAALRIHRRLFERAADPMVAAGAGRMKIHPNGTFDPEAPGSIFYYTAPTSTAAALAAWEAFTAEADERPELVRQALSHWLFEHIHPVPDGNGRVGRLLLPLTLRRKGALRHACAFLGEAVHLDKTLYVDALKDARRRGEFSAWVRVVCAMLAQSAASNLERLEKLGGVHARWREATQSVRAHSVVHRLVPWIITRPTFTVRDAMTFSEGAVTFQAMNTGIRRLIDLGIVTQRDGGGRDRLFTAPEVVRLFDPISLP
ncbi:adenosine monophosphate-protein transferase SoFic [mine drainage metagenome]|uniref:Adenosine monophosphate-protein transferase SoFic n=1 Tax=mine drainage metagenome TaxID=410659 RepID=A0A1J5TD66_9ZZZZ